MKQKKLFILCFVISSFAFVSASVDIDISSLASFEHDPVSINVKTDDPNSVSNATISISNSVNSGNNIYPNSADDLNFDNNKSINDLNSGNNENFVDMKPGSNETINDAISGNNEIISESDDKNNEIINDVKSWNDETINDAVPGNIETINDSISERNITFTDSKPRKKRQFDWLNPANLVFNTKESQQSPSDETQGRFFQVVQKGGNSMSQLDIFFGVAKQFLEDVGDSFENFAERFHEFVDHEEAINMANEAATNAIKSIIDKFQMDVAVLVAAILGSANNANSALLGLL